MGGSSPDYQGPASAANYINAADRAANAWTMSNTRLSSISRPAVRSQRIRQGNSLENNGEDAATYTSSCSGGVWNPQPLCHFNAYYINGYNQAARVQVMVHEEGHALALARARTSMCNDQPVRC